MLHLALENNALKENSDLNKNRCVTIREYISTCHAESTGYKDIYNPKSHSTLITMPLPENTAANIGLNIL